MILLRKIDSIKLFLMKVMCIKAAILECDGEADVCFISYVSYFSLCFTVQSNVITWVQKVVEW